MLRDKDKRFADFIAAMKLRGVRIYKKRNAPIYNDGIHTYSLSENEDGTLDVLTETSTYYRIEGDCFEEWRYMVGGTEFHEFISKF